MISISAAKLDMKNSVNYVKELWLMLITLVIEDQGKLISSSSIFLTGHPRKR